MTQKSVRIGLLATHENEELERLQDAARQNGHEATVLKVQKFGLSIYPDHPQIYYDGKSIHDDYDVIIPRVDIPYTDFGFEVLRQFQAIGTYVTDTAYALELARNKVRSFQYLMKKNVPFPRTGSAFATEGYKNILNTIGEEPFIIKLNQGTQGVGVFLAQDQRQAENFLGTFEQLDTEVMVQEFIEEAAGSDLRCFIVGGEIVGAMCRKSQGEDFRANISLGGTAEKADLSEEEKRVALEASAAMNLNVSGVDIVRSKRGPLVIEINGAPDFCGEFGLEKVCNVDVADKMIRFALDGKHKHDRGEGVWLSRD